jgi:hypothetical protein
MNAYCWPISCYGVDTIRLARERRAQRFKGTDVAKGQEILDGSVPQ